MGEAVMRNLLAVFTVVGTVILTMFAAPSEARYRGNCNTKACKQEVIAPHRDYLNALMACETRGLRGDARWKYNGSSGYDGAFQFSPATWNSTGSRFAYAYLAHPREQRYRAVVHAHSLGYNWRSTAGWPNCP